MHTGNKKRCIFHMPNPIYEDGKSGSSIRPKKMLEAFKKIGYDVDVVAGYGYERRYKIKEIKEKIKSGIKYDFMYSENATIPTMLTEKNHIPKYGNMDFKFFKLCDENEIPIGLFYRDIYWKFDIYKESVKGILRHFLIALYKYDLRQYKKYINCLFLPTMMMEKYIENKYLPSIVIDLPPGAEYRDMARDEKIANKNLNLLYVGGIGELYRFDALLEAIHDLKNIKLTVCCREEEWENNRKIYEPYMTENVNIVHKSGDELENLYNDADICVALFKTTEYRKMAMPVKIFEYLSYHKPIIATSDTAAGKFVEENNIGWSITYGTKEIQDLIIHILNNKQMLYDVKDNMHEKLISNTWENRANKVADILLCSKR